MSNPSPNLQQESNQNPYPQLQQQEPTWNQEQQHSDYVAFNNNNNNNNNGGDITITQPLILGDQYANEGNPQKQEEIDMFLKIIKYLNMGSGVFVSVVGFYLIVTLNLWQFHNFMMSLYSMFLPAFYIFFGLVLIGCDYYKGEINIYFRFLRSFLGRGVYNIFLATQCTLAWQYPGALFAWILMILGCIYIFLFFIRGKVESEIKEKLLN